MKRKHKTIALWILLGLDILFGIFYAVNRYVKLTEHPEWSVNPKVTFLQMIPFLMVASVLVAFIFRDMYRLRRS